VLVAIVIAHALTKATHTINTPFYCRGSEHFVILSLGDEKEGERPGRPSF